MNTPIDVTCQKPPPAKLLNSAISYGSSHNSSCIATSRYRSESLSFTIQHPMEHSMLQGKQIQQKAAVNRTSLACMEGHASLCS